MSHQKSAADLATKLTKEGKIEEAKLALAEAERLEAMILDHRLEFDENMANTDPLVRKIFRILNQIQESPEMERLMELEDILLLEQKQAEEARTELDKELKKERALRKKADRKREEEQRKREESDRKREAAEAEIARLRKLLEDDKN